MRSFPLLVRPLAVLASLVLFSLASASVAAAPLIADTSFEERSTGWTRYEDGYEVDTTVAHTGKASIRCVNATADRKSGAVWRAVPDQKTAAPIQVIGWSKAEGVDSFPNNDYSIYVDVAYADGDRLWGQTAPFDVGTHDWQRRTVLIVPPKPIRSFTVYALFRGHSGKVWFDDFSAEEISADHIFDSQPITPPGLPLSRKYAWFARDVAAGSPILPFATGSAKRAQPTAESLGLRLETRKSARPEEDTVVVRDTTGRDRAITVYYAERFDDADPVWWQDSTSSARAREHGESTNGVRAGRIGATGTVSAYPFACVTGKRQGRLLGFPPLLGPRVSRLGYHAGSKLLYAAFDVALTARNTANPGSAGVAVVRVDTPPAWGFRAATAAYYALYPEVFKRRATAEGIWIPFLKPSAVPNPHDFGIRYHEGDNSVAEDDALDVLSFRYTEPMTWWMAMPVETPRTYEAAMEIVRRYAAGTNAAQKRAAQMVLNSGSRDRNGNFNVQFQNAPWTNGAIWLLNPNPALPGAADRWTKALDGYGPEQTEKRYASTPPAGLDGEYLDSIEGWSEVLDYGEDALRYAKEPPTFTTEEHAPVVPTWFSVYEYAKYLSADLHRRGRLLMANSTPWKFWAFMPLLDVAGTETNWNPAGSWTPNSESIFNMRRTLSYHKPYLLLQNTDFTKFGAEQTERYLERCLFYAVYPSMFSANASTDVYWSQPALYERDRPIFRKYIPAFQKLSAAGWEPVTYVRADNQDVRVERYGREYVTVLNLSDKPTRTTLAFEWTGFGSPLGSGSAFRLDDLVTGQNVASAPAGVSSVPVDLLAGQVRALSIATGSSGQ